MSRLSQPRRILIAELTSGEADTLPQSLADAQVGRDVSTTLIDSENWRSLIEEIRTGSFHGILVVRIPEIDTNELLDYLTNRATQVTRSAVELQQGLVPDGSLLSILGSVHCLRENGEQAVILTGSLEESAELSQSFRFHVVELEQFDSVVGAELLLGPEVHGFDPRQAISGLCGVTQERWLTLWEEEVRARVSQEFLDPIVERAFQDLCDNCFQSLNHFAMEHRILGSLRLGRQIAGWTLEGKPFQCTVLLTTEQHYSKLLDAELMQLASFDRPIPFTFDYATLIRDHTEMVQAEDLLLWVDIQTGALRTISVLQAQGHRDSYRAIVLPNLVRDCGVALHMREGSFVEVYNKRELVLWHDGFQWHTRPFAFLQSILNDFFSPPNSQSITNLINGISTLLDRRESSILVLLSSLDEQALPHVVSNLREGVLFHPGAFSPDTLSLSSLVGILHLDGAHVISPNGTFYQISQHIRSVNLSKFLVVPESANSVQQWRDDYPEIRSNYDPQSRMLLIDGELGSEALEVLKNAIPNLDQLEPTPESQSEQGHRHGPGTGRKAAMELSQFLANSVVMKVSAGGAISFFRRGRAL